MGTFIIYFCAAKAKCQWLIIWRFRCLRYGELGNISTDSSCNYLHSAKPILDLIKAYSDGDTEENSHNKKIVTRLQEVFR